MLALYCFVFFFSSIESLWKAYSLLSDVLIQTAAFPTNSTHKVASRNAFYQELQDSWSSLQSSVTGHNPWNGSYFVKGLLLKTRWFFSPRSLPHHLTDAMFPYKPYPTNPKKYYFLWASQQAKNLPDIWSSRANLLLVLNSSRIIKEPKGKN